jgi:ubiquinone/menaquinone biosynthesis C-methylase UbiE
MAVKSRLTTAVEWDVPTWSRAVLFWQKSIVEQRFSVKNGLEIGGRHGGLSWYFATQFGSTMCCTDTTPPSAQALSLHRDSGLQASISYAIADATCLPFEDQSFDFVVFKSVLGVIGAHGHTEAIPVALSEMHRVLRPGGVLFFAENLRGSQAHQMARKIFVPWGSNWHYLTEHELVRLLAPFVRKKIRTTGFLSAFAPKPAWLKELLSRIDEYLLFIPPSWRYVGYGFAVKKDNNVAASGTFVEEVT